MPCNNYKSFSYVRILFLELWSSKVSVLNIQIQMVPGFPKRLVLIELSSLSP